jgi:hypothetical protein
MAMDTRAQGDGVGRLVDVSCVELSLEARKIAVYGVPDGRLVLALDGFRLVKLAQGEGNDVCTLVVGIRRARVGGRLDKLRIIAIHVVGS